MARILLLVTKTSYRAQAFLEAAARLGVEAVVGSDHRPALAELVPDRAIELPLADPDESARAITRFADEVPLDAVIAAEDEGVLAAAHAAARLGLPHNPPAAAETARLKHRLRERLAEARLPGPGFRVASIDDDPARLAEELRFPCVAKPVHLAASRGVIRADHPAGFVEAFARLSRLLEEPELAARGGTWARTILVEDYVPGAEVALEGLLDGGRLRVLAIFDKPDPLEGPFFEETIYVTPSRLPEHVQAEIADAVSRAAAALGLRTGPVHAELRLPGESPVLLEIAPRSIGGHCARVLRFGPDRISLEELILRQALGMDVTGWRREPAAAGVMMIPIPRAGVLREVRGVADAKRVPRVEDVTIAIPPGREVVPLPEGSRYLGFIFARAGEPAEAEAALRMAHACLHVEIQA